MSLQKKVTNIVFYYIKQHYKEHLIKNELRYIPEDDIRNVVDSFYKTEKGKLKQFIRESLKKMLNEYPGPLIENIIYDIFEDEELAKERVILEIKLYQENNKEELENQILNNSYEVYITPHTKYGMGLSLTVNCDGIVITGFKTDLKTNSKLPAEKCNLINIGDRLLEINGNDVDNMSVNDSVVLLKNLNYSDTEVTLKLLNVIKLKTSPKKIYPQPRQRESPAV